jgi:DNA polymerase III epsilon subunit-like protein
MSSIAIIDFETTGISPNMGDRATEVAIVMLEGGQVVDRYQSLMNAGVRVNSFITQLTGITNEMVQAAPPAEQVMREAARFVGGRPMVAHNAAFDKKFWQAELARCGKTARTPLPAPCCCRAACTRMRPTTSWARWLRCTICRRQAAPTGPWPMPRWPRICWRRCSTT